ncbi:MAG: hypothetical protein ABR953_13170 [Candidatus Acidiferrales bacterium]|jgi:hypothetical protein
MGVNTTRVLLIAASPMGVSFLVTRLKKWACDICFTSSCKEAQAFVSNQQFDLVLSEFRLRDGSCYSLTNLLIGSNTTLVYSYPVETGCWWLPAVRNGESCWGSRAMQPSEFMGFLDDTLKEIRSRETASSDELGEPLFKVAAK